MRARGWGTLPLLFLAAAIPTEQPLKIAAIQYLQMQGYYAVRVQSGKIQNAFTGSWIQLAPPGTPDIIACIAGKFVGIEVKKDDAEVRRWENQYKKFEQTRIYSKSAERSIAQHHAHAMIEQAGGLVLVVASLEELQRDIQEIT